MDTGDTPIVTMTDLFRFDQPENAKVKLNRHPGPDSTPAWDLLAGDADGRFGMNTYRGKKKDSNNNMGGREYLFTFAQYYIFGGLYRMTEIRPGVYETCGYRMEHDDRYAGYEKRLIIRIDHSLSEKEIYLRLYDRIQNQLHPEVYEISPHVKTETFEGYDRVNLTYQTLHRIVACDDPEWKAALSRIKAVYVLTDLSNGRLSSAAPTVMRTDCGAVGRHTPTTTIQPAETRNCGDWPNGAAPVTSPGTSRIRSWRYSTRRPRTKSFLTGNPTGRRCWIRSDTDTTATDRLISLEIAIDAPDGIVQIQIIVADDRFSGKTSPTVTWLERMRIWGSPGG